MHEWTMFGTESWGIPRFPSWKPSQLSPVTQNSQNCSYGVENLWFHSIVIYKPTLSVLLGSNAFLILTIGYIYPATSASTFITSAVF